MKRLLLLFIIFSTSLISAQEVAKTVIVEHFTNTYCSVCASRNPGFYTNLNNHPDILHIAYHPSAPYSACPLNQHNVNENDARTNFYGVYGATPRLAVQGNVIPAGNDYSSPALFDPFEGDTSPYELTTSISQNTLLDSLIIEVVISKVAASSLDSLNFYGVIVEETLNFNANNGENNHYDVFRRSLVGENPVKIKLPETTGQDTTITYRVKIDGEWTGNELKSVVLLQDDQKQIEQAAESENLDFMVNLDKLEMNKVLIFPNPVHNIATVITDDEINNIRLISSQGKVVKEMNPIGNKYSFTTHRLPSGIYFIQINTLQNSIVKRLVKQ